MNLKTQSPATQLLSGQVWQMTDANLQISAVGKHLVHYKLIKGQTKRTPTSLSAIRAVQEYLRKHKAVLVHG